MYEDEKIRAAGDLSMRKEGRGATLLRSLYIMRNSGGGVPRRPGADDGGGSRQEIDG